MTNGSSVLLFSRSARIWNASSSYSWAISHLQHNSVGTNQWARINIPWRFRQPWHRAEQDDHEYQLERQWKSPGNRSGGEGETVRHPIRQREASNVQDQFNDDQLATPLQSRGFRLPNGRCGCIDAISDASHNSPNYQLWHAVGRNLDESANSHDRGADQDCLLPAKDFTQPQSNAGADEASYVVESYNSSCAQRSDTLETLAESYTPKRPVCEGPARLWTFRKSGVTITPPGLGQSWSWRCS